MCMKCLICNLDIPNRQKLAHHLSTIHNTNTADYKIKYKPDKNSNLLECPICGKYNMKQLTQHITDIHKITKDEFLLQYPNTKLWIDEISVRCSKAQSIGLQTVRENIAKDPHYYDESYVQRANNRDYTEIADKVRKTRLERGSNEKMSERVKLLWQNEDYRNMQVEKAKKQHKQGLTKIIMEKSGKKRYNITLGSETYHMRSTWEVKVATDLYERHIKFKYEPFAIPYKYNEVTKLYYPDFYLEDYNIIIEVKPLRLCENEVVIAKKNACLEQGYKFMFITDIDIDNLTEIIYE